MFPTDRDTGRADFAATPATRGDAEQALRDLVTGTSEVSSGDTCEGLCPECAIELALKEAASKGLTPESPEFGEIFERIFAEGNPGGDVKVRFLGAQKIGEPMSVDLKTKLDAAGAMPFPFSAEQLDEMIRSIPPIPDIYGTFKPSLDSTALVPLPPLFREPSNPTIGGDRDELPGLDALLARIFGNDGQEDDEDGVEEFEEERRGVVQDLTAAALNLTEQLHEPGAEDTAAALRDIAALARETYEI